MGAEPGSTCCIPMGMCEHTVNLRGWKHANTHCSAGPLTATQALLAHWQRILPFATTIKQHRAACFCPWKVSTCTVKGIMPAPPPSASHTDSPSWKPICILGGSDSSRCTLFRIKGRMRNQENNSSHNS